MCNNFPKHSQSAKTLCELPFYTQSLRVLELKQKYLFIIGETTMTLMTEHGKSEFQSELRQIQKSKIMVLT